MNASKKSCYLGAAIWELLFGSCYLGAAIWELLFGVDTAYGLVHGIAFFSDFWGESIR